MSELQNIALTLKGAEPYRYEILNVIRIFYPGVSVIDGKANDFTIKCRAEKEKDITRLTVFSRIGEREYRFSSFVENTTSQYKWDVEAALAQNLYHALHQVTKITPPWGILTGVRPVKMVQNYLDRGYTAQQLEEEFYNRFYVTKSRLDLCLRCADVQHHCLPASTKRDVSLYISIPFCPSRCVYCSFVSHSIEKAAGLMEPYVTALLQELAETFEKIERLNLNLKTVYVGGGTPTTLSAKQLDRLLGYLFSMVKKPLEECTVEAGRPDTLNAEKFAVMAKYPVTRVNINPQTLNDDVLARIGRRHTAQDIVDKFHMAREAGFKNINMDLIAGLPGDDYASFCKSLDGCIALGAENITVHTLSIKHAASLKWQSENVYCAKSDEVVAMQDYAAQQLSKAGYEPYYLYRQKNTVANLENVGYAKPGYEGLYNIYMMEELHTILGCGAGSVTKLVDPKNHKIVRIANYKYPQEYLRGQEALQERKKGVDKFYADFSKE